MWKSQHAKVVSTKERDSKEQLSRSRSYAVVGGGIAGLAAATVLAERGAQVTVFEQSDFLGGRAGAWTETGENGRSFEMERGFHAFFRHYYNLRELLRRIDPNLSILTPLTDYPILGPEGRVQSFANLPKQTPWNIMALIWRTQSIQLRDLLGMNIGAALEMLRYDQKKTYTRFDGMNADEYLNSLEFPPEARQMLFNVFSRSFFNPEANLSAAELLMLFHFYFLGNPEGLIFDVSSGPFSTAIWKPLSAHLGGLGVKFNLNCSVDEIERVDQDKVRIIHNAETLLVDGCVLATNVSGLKAIADASPTLDHTAWQSRIGRLELTAPFVVWRLWLDQPTHPTRSPFVGTTGVKYLDNISLYHRFEDESRDWSTATGGAVVELHAYGVPHDIDQAELRKELLAGLRLFYPETHEARILEERYLWRQDCPEFAIGSYRARPTVETPFANIALAGDYVRLPFPSALMERAAASGFMAANQLLTVDDVTPQPVFTVPTRGKLLMPQWWSSRRNSTRVPSFPE